MVSLRVGCPGGRVLELACLGFALAQVLGPPHAWNPVPHLRFDTVRPCARSRRLLPGDRTESLDVHCLFDNSRIRFVRGRCPFFQTASDSIRVATSQDQTRVGHHLGSCDRAELAVPAREPLT